MKTSFISATTTFLLVILIIVNGCGGGDGGSENTAPNVSLEKSEAEAASAIKVTGLDVETCPLSTAEFKVGGETAPALLNERGEVIMMLPLFYDESTKWSKPPEGPQDVEIYCNGSRLTTLSDAVTVTELQPAPGTTEVIIADYAQAIADFEEIMAVLSPDPDIQQMFFTSYISAVEELLTGTSENSLPAVMAALSQDNPEILALIDAVHAANGLNETASMFKDLMTDLKIDVLTAQVSSAELMQPAEYATAAIHKATDATKAYVDILTDYRLAQQIRVYETINNFQEQVISQDTKYTADPVTALSLISSVLSVVGKKVPYVAAASLILGTVNLAVKTLVVSALPAELKKIKLTVHNTKLVNLEYTDSNITLNAENSPKPFKLTDLFSVVLNALGIASNLKTGTQWVNQVREALEAKVSFFTDVAGVYFEKFVTAHPELGIVWDMDTVDAIPPIDFNASATTRELYTLYPRPGGSDAEIIHPLTDRLEWQADDKERGSATVFVETVPGKFGESMVTSNEQIVQVGGPFSLVLEQHVVNIPEGSTQTVGVKLSAQPPQDQNVTVSVQRTSGDTDISVTSAHTIIFDSKNWDDYQDISLTAAEDDDVADGSASILISSDVSIGEQNMTIKDTITAIENDNDKLYFITNTNTVFIPEGDTGTFEVRLNRDPNTTVTATISHTSGDSDISLQSSNILIFDETNWNIYQTVTLFASVDDDNISGSAEFQISGSLPEIGNAFVIANEQEENAYANTFEVEGSYNFSVESVNGYYSATWYGIVPLTFTDDNLVKRTIWSEGLLEYHESGTWVQVSYLEPDREVLCTKSGDGTLRGYLFGFRWSTEGTPYYELEDHYYYNNVYYSLNCADGYSASWVETFDTNNIVFDGHHFILDESNNYTESYYIGDNLPRSMRIELMDKTKP